MTEPSSPEAHPQWETIAVTSDGDIVELRFHSEAGPLAWTPSLDGPRLTGSHLHIPDDTSDGGGP